VKEGDVILAPLPQADGMVKNRPALFLRELPAWGDVLVCGISTQSRQVALNFDEAISRTDSDYSDSGLVADSTIRLGFLAVLPRRRIIGVIGSVTPERHARLLERLAAHLTEHIKKTAARRDVSAPEA